MSDSERRREAYLLRKDSSMWRRIVGAMLAVAFVVGLAGCGDGTASDAPAPKPDTQPTSEPGS